MNSNRRNVLSAAATFATLALLLVLYWAGTIKRMVPSLSTPLREALRLAQPNGMALTNQPPPLSFRASAQAAEAAPPPGENRADTPLPGPGDRPEVPQLEGPPELAEQDAPEPPPDITSPGFAALSVTATNITPDDVRVAQSWLVDANERPSIRVTYNAGDILRLSSELNRGVLVASGEETNQAEVYFEAYSGEAPRISVFTRSVAEHFADYAIFLRPSPVFPSVALKAIFPRGYRLAFVPDRPLAALMFTHIARASRLLGDGRPGTHRPVFEGKLSLVEAKPVFEVVTVRIDNKPVKVAAAEDSSDQPTASASIGRARGQPPK